MCVCSSITNFILQKYILKRNDKQNIVSWDNHSSQSWNNRKLPFPNRNLWGKKAKEKEKKIEKIVI